MKLRGQKKLKIIDRYLGIPIVFFLGLLRFRKQLPLQIKKVNVLLTPAIGDTIIASAVLKDLKEKFAPVKLVFFVPQENKEAALLTGIADEVITYRLSDLPGTLRLFRQNKCDLFIDTSQWARLNAILTFFSGSRFTIGFSTKGEYRKYSYDRTVVHSSKVHELENYRRLVAAAGVISASMPEIKAESALEPDKVSVHVNASGYLSYLKEWPVNYWAQVINYLKEKNFRIYFTGSASDYSYIESILDKSGDRNNLFNMAGKFNLKETAEHLKSCRLVISVNTGIMHMAAAVGANLVALHGPTNSARWGPLNSNSVIIKSVYPSAPCLNLGFEYNCSDRTGECMKAIQPLQVLEAVNSFIGI